MADKMLIDASHEEETRVVVVRGNRIEEFDFESQHKKQIRGNIYLAKVTRVEPSLQAAFVDYGGNRHGFLAFAEIHPDYYQIPLADRQALLRAEAEEHRRDDDVEHVETAPVDLSTQEQPDVGCRQRLQREAAPEVEAAAVAETVEAVAEVAEEAPAKKAKPRRSRKKACRLPKMPASDEAVSRSLGRQRGRRLVRATKWQRWSRRTRSPKRSTPAAAAMTTMTTITTTKRK